MAEQSEDSQDQERTVVEAPLLVETPLWDTADHDNFLRPQTQEPLKHLLLLQYQQGEPFVSLIVTPSRVP